MLAEKYKNEGNKYFRKQNYEKAIEWYNKAIKVDNSQVVFFTNRATAKFKLDEKKYPQQHKAFRTWLSDPALPGMESEVDDEDPHTDHFPYKTEFTGDPEWLLLVVEDCHEAMFCDVSSMKAFFYTGIVFLMQKRLFRAWREFQRSYELAVESQSTSAVEVRVYMDKIKAKLNYGQKSSRFQSRMPLYQKILQLLEKNYNQECNAMNKKHEGSAVSFRRNLQYQKEIQDLASEYHTNVQELRNTFKPTLVKGLEDKTIKEKHLKTKSGIFEGKTLDSEELKEIANNLDVSFYEIPEYLLDPIGFTFFVNPVVAPSGYTYEKKWIESYVAKHNTDPFTHEPLAASQLYPNTVLKTAIQQFIEEHQKL